MDARCQCGRPVRKGQHQGGYCREYHAEAQRQWRATHPLTAEQRRKSNCRSYAHVYLRRGLLVKEPCQDCGIPDSQMHHADYDKPLQVTWLCPGCHGRRHAVA